MYGSVTAFSGVQPDLAVFNPQVSKGSTRSTPTLHYLIAEGDYYKEV